MQKSISQKERKASEEYRLRACKGTTDKGEVTGLQTFCAINAKEVRENYEI